MPPAGRAQRGRGGKQAGQEGDRTRQQSEDAEVNPSWAPRSRSFRAADRCRASQSPCDVPRPPAASQPPTPSRANPAHEASPSLLESTVWPHAPRQPLYALTSTALKRGDEHPTLDAGCELGGQGRPHGGLVGVPRGTRTLPALKQQRSPRPKGAFPHLCIVL